MDVLEALVSDTLAEHADDAPPAAGLLEAVIAAPRRRAGWLVLGAAAAAVLLAVALSAALSRTHRASEAAPGHSPTASRAPTSTGPLSRYKTVAYHGVVLTVPENLPVRTTACGLPASYVLADDPNVAAACTAPGAMPRRGAVTVNLDVGPGPGAFVNRTAPATGTDYVQDAGVTVTVAAPTLTEVRHVLATVRTAPDPDGCPARSVQPADPPARHLVPGHPETLVRCVYATAGWLQASMRVSLASAVADRVDALPAGTGTAGNQSWEHDQLRFGYADGSVRTVDVRVGAPSVFSDGSRTADDRGNHVMDLIARLSH